MALDVNLLVVHVAKIDKDDVDDRCHLELDVVAFVDDGCSDSLCCCCEGVQMTIFSETLRSKTSSWTVRGACCATPCCTPVVDTFMM